MAKLADLRHSAEELISIVRTLSELARAGEDEDDKTNEHAVVKRLLTLVGDSNTITPADLNERAEAIGAARSALSEIIIQDTLSQTVFDSTAIRIVKARRNSLQRTFGRLLERTAFDPIADLLSSNEIKQISDTLTAADKDIRDRQKAKDILDSIVGVAVKAADVALKLA